MDLEEANSVADAIASLERTKSESLTRAGAATRHFMDRLRVGVFTLMGAYFGWRVAESYFGPGLASVGVGFVVGLAVAVTFPGRKA